MRKRIVLGILISFFLLSTLSAASSFSGYAGGRLNYAANPDKEQYDPDLKLQAFFMGQFNFTQNLWSHIEFSLNTGDLLGQSLFHETDSKFQIDEISLICRGNLSDFTNYLSFFLGTYDPIGSDIFLQRYFNITPIGSKITENYLGRPGSILYPHFGIGIADIAKLHSIPLAFGPYLYVNHEDDKYYVLNGDLRIASVMRFLTIDFAVGIGIPLADKYKGEDVLIAVEKVYWHAGTTILLGNNFTNSLFLQAGVYNASFMASNSNSIVSPKDIYLLIEPRLVLRDAHLNITLFNLPPDTVKQLLFIEDTLGININAYTTTSLAGINSFTYGSHISVGLIGKNFLTIKDSLSEITEKSYNINISPYMTCNFLSGELHLQGTIRIMEFFRGRADRAISIDLGYRTKF